MSDRFATDVPDIELAEYQRAVRVLLRHPLISDQYPDAKALPLVRRWSAQLRADLSEALGYRLELSSTSARLVRAIDDVDPDHPARTRTGRTFDRKRYAYLALVLATLGRAGVQVALSDLADVVAADANRIDGLGLDTGRGPDRAAFVDVVTWLEDRGALRLADGSARAWADDPGRSEALYDIDRDVVLAVYRPTRVLHHIGSIGALLARPTGAGRDSGRRDAAQRARRALVELPVVYYEEVDAGVRNILRTPGLAADVSRLTGLVVERRAEGLALIDTAGLAERRFPATGSVVHAALLLAREIADRIIDPDAPPLRRHPAPHRGELRQAMVAAIDQGLPVSGVLAELVADERPSPVASSEAADDPIPSEHPLLEDGWLASTMGEVIERYATTFRADWRADPPRLLAAALDLLSAHRLVEPVDGGVLALPLLARYRNVTVQVRRREPTLFDLEEAL